MLLKQNCLHYYINLLRMPDHAQRSSEQSEHAVQALHNVIRTMRFSRHDNICGEDFSDLDFGNIPLNEVHWSNNGEDPCSFHGCCLNEWNFMSGHFSSIFAVAWSLDGKYILTCSHDNTAIVWNAQTGLMMRKLVGHKSRVLSGCFFKDGKRCITSSADGSAKVWDCVTGECIITMVDNSVYYIKRKNEVSTENAWIYSVTLSPDECYCLTGSNILKMWDLKTGKCIKSFYGHLGSIDFISFLEDGECCLTGSIDGTVKMLNIKTGEYLRTIVVGETGNYHPDFIDLKTGEHDVQDISLSKDGKHLLVGKGEYQKGYAEIWDLELDQCIVTLNGHTAGIETVAYSPNGEYCLTGSHDDTAKLWNTKTGECIRTLSHTHRHITSVTFSPDGKYCLTAGHDNRVLIWDVRTGMLVKCLNSYMLNCWDNSLSPNNRLLLIGSYDKTAKLWDIEQRKFIMTLLGHNKSVMRVTFSSDGNYFLTYSMERVNYWKSDDFECVKSFDCENSMNGHTSWIEAIVVTHDGKSFLTCSYDKTAKIWDLKSGRCIKTFTGHTERVFSAAFSPDDQYVLTVSEDETAILWSVETEEMLHVLKGHKSMVYSVAISPSGKYALTGDWNGTAILWDIKTGKKVYSFEVLNGHTINSLSFSADEKYCFTGSSAHIAKFWCVKNGECCQTITLPQDARGGSEWFLPYCITDFFFIHSIYKVDGNAFDDHQQAKYIDTLYNINGVYIQNCDFNNVNATDVVKKILFQYGGITDSLKEN